MLESAAADSGLVIEKGWLDAVPRPDVLVASGCEGLNTIAPEPLTPEVATDAALV